MNLGKMQRCNREQNSSLNDKNNRYNCDFIKYLIKIW